MASNVEEQKIYITMSYLSSLQSVEDINADDFIQNFIYNDNLDDNLDAEYIVNNNIFDILFDIYFALNPPVAIEELTEEIFYDENKKPYVTLNDNAWKANSNRYYYYDILYEANKYYLTNLNSQSTFNDILTGVLTNFILNTNYYYQMLPDPGTSSTDTVETFIEQHNYLQKSYLFFWKFVFTQLKDIFSSTEEIDLETALRELANNILTYFVHNNLDFVKIIIDIYYNFLPDYSTVFTNINEQLRSISYTQSLINNEPIRIKNNTKSNKENKSRVLNRTIGKSTIGKSISGKSKTGTKRRKSTSGTTSGTTSVKSKIGTSGKSKKSVINTMFKLNNPRRELFPIPEEVSVGGSKRTRRRKKNKRKNKRKNKKTRKYRKRL